MTRAHDGDDGLPASLRDRILKDLQAQPAPTRSVVRKRTALFLIVAFAISLAIFWLLDGVRVTYRPTWLVEATAGGSFFLAFAVAWVSFGRGRSALGRPRILLTGVAMASPALLLFWKIWVSSQVSDGLNEWPQRPGFKCLGLTLATGLGPLVAFVLARRGSDPVHPVALGAALGAASGTFAASLADLWCPVAYLPHMLLGHVLPLVTLTCAGALLGRYLKPR